MLVLPVSEGPSSSNVVADDVDDEDEDDDAGIWTGWVLTMSPTLDRLMDGTNE